MAIWVTGDSTHRCSIIRAGAASMRVQWAMLHQARGLMHPYRDHESGEYAAPGASGSVQRRLHGADWKVLWSSPDRQRARHADLSRDLVNVPLRRRRESARPMEDC